MAQIIDKHSQKHLYFFLYFKDAQPRQCSAKKVSSKTELFNPT